VGSWGWARARGDKVALLEGHMWRHRLLLHLDLASNFLGGNLEVLRPLTMLQWLSVADNKLVSDRGLAGLPIERLNFANNMVRPS
jgi:hypothetical protein